MNKPIPLEPLSFVPHSAEPSSLEPRSLESPAPEPLALNILMLRGEIAEFGGAIRQLQRSGLDSASAQILIARKRAELECLMNRGSENSDTLKR